MPVRGSPPRAGSARPRRGGRDRRGERVLDIATGSGNVAVLAGQAGAQVVGIDITDAWFDEARARAAVAGVDVDLRLGDAEDLPIGDESFDVVPASFGAIFAPRHDLVASELARVCRPGGVIALTSWTPGGSNDTLTSTRSSRLPPPPEFVTPPTRWGDPAHVRELFATTDVAATFGTHDLEADDGRYHTTWEFLLIHATKAP